jgi:hypothetical protein
MHRIVLVLVALAAIALLAATGVQAVPDQQSGPAVSQPPEEAKRLSELLDPGAARRYPATARKYPVRPDQVPGLGRKYAKYRPFGWRCWYAPDMKFGIGGWPYQQVIVEERYWCGYAEGGATTYLWFTPHTESYLCRPYNAWAVNWGGGVGYNHHMVHSQSDFSCPTNLDWYYIHHVVWQQWHCDTYTWTPCIRTDDGWYS